MLEIFLTVSLRSCPIGRKPCTKKFGIIRIFNKTLKVVIKIIIFMKLDINTLAVIESFEA